MCCVLAFILCYTYTGANRCVQIYMLHHDECSESYWICSKGYQYSSLSMGCYPSVLGALRLSSIAMCSRYPGTPRISKLFFFVWRNSNPLDGTVSSSVIGASDSSSSNQMTGSISSSPPASILSSVVTIAPSTGVDSTNGPVQGNTLCIMCVKSRGILHCSVFTDRYVICGLIRQNYSWFTKTISF